MATIKVKFRPATVADHEGSIYYQIIHQRKPRQLLSGYRVFPSEWNEKESKVIVRQSGPRSMFITSVHEQICLDLERFSKIIRNLDDRGITYTSGDVIDEFVSYSNRYSLFKFMDAIIDGLKKNGKLRTSETYTATLRSFKKFRNEKDIMLDCLNSQIMEGYAAWLKGRGNRPNTISFYTRILRAVYNRAVEEDIIEDRHPFRHVYTGVDKTVKRALPLRIIKKIKTLDLSLVPALDYARDMFMLSFMLRGMSFIDMSYLRKCDLVNGYITYRRRKTGQLLTIKWTKEMQGILDKYPENRSEYLLPIIKKKGTNERYTYRNVGYNVNHNLKAISQKIGIPFPLTLYVARHSWASAAKEKGIPLSVISEGMGHESEATTQIYLASLDNSIVDKANALIIKSL
ncbi:MAG: site-specific integrase [Muribaculaceae bacterium]|nr:site-specific integrase [Muribaculaceae bacterium]